jgi:hypothetical protein
VIGAAIIIMMEERSELVIEHCCVDRSPMTALSNL